MNYYFYKSSLLKNVQQKSMESKMAAAVKIQRFWRFLQRRNVISDILDEMTLEIAIKRLITLQRVFRVKQRKVLLELLVHDEMMRMERDEMFAKRAAENRSRLILEEPTPSRTANFS